MKYMIHAATLLKDAAKRFVREEDGVGVVEIILILVILVGLVLLFKNQISQVVSSALSAFKEDATSITK